VVIIQINHHFVKHFFLSLFLLAGTIALSAQSSLPSVNLKTLEGKSVNIQDFARNGKITVISFWATWCTPCKKELDAIAKDYKRWTEEYGMELVAVTVDDQRALPRVKPLVSQKRWEYIILSDVKQDFQQAMSVQTIPHTYVVDKNGKIVYSHNGYLPGDEKKLEQKLKELAKG
jgi:cytochrome c biogenesis protein CcmG, thiol:disulfide interchange protein DsbE